MLPTISSVRGSPAAEGRLGRGTGLYKGFPNAITTRQRTSLAESMSDGSTCWRGGRESGEKMAAGSVSTELTLDVRDRVVSCGVNARVKCVVSARECDRFSSHESSSNNKSVAQPILT